MSFLPILMGTGITAAQQLEQTAEQAYSFQSQSQLDWQSLTFDTAMNQQAENMREINTLRDVDMQQRKADDTITKKFIESIGS